jgi:hypothetical protein
MTETGGQHHRNMHSTASSSSLFRHSDTSGVLETHLSNRSIIGYFVVLAQFIIKTKKNKKQNLYMTLIIKYLFLK